MRLFPLVLASLIAAPAFAASTPARQDAATATTLKLQGVVIDRTGMVLANAWTVSESQAQWAPPFGSATYQYAMPSRIPPAGAPVTLTVSGTAAQGSRFAPRLGISGGVEIRGEAPFEVGALAESGETKSASKTFTLVPGNHAAGSLVSVVVGLQDGARITFQYRAEATGPAASKRAQSAIAWAKSQLGSEKWRLRCLLFVANAYGAPISGFPSAAVAAEELGVRKRPLGGAPIGALVFFDAVPGLTAKTGHVGIYLGGGKFISSLGTVKVATISRNNVWGRSYSGWIVAPASWPGRP